MSRNPVDSIRDIELLLGQEVAILVLILYVERTVSWRRLANTNLGLGILETVPYLEVIVHDLVDQLRALAADIGTRIDVDDDPETSSMCSNPCVLRVKVVSPHVCYLTVSGGRRRR